ncbi:hypothetical protein ALI144C_10835 [Actinosynnema sp. ALI-1.44]|uniref:hypothetical protein n=1 Tax=Actinosynnema sp. ALI-1.44 TaxID=1933779 RepID=UPI00097C50AF|nr:hypothetical protein [Actinosynnema sp. ALI-1.44]ONI86415.1 hypothetical protein ALI144C_10835 [Actinosynnema sp. ALI-1.44]
MKRIVWSCVALALGVLFVVAATFALLDDKVSCGGKTMTDGDICVRENRSGTVVSEDSIDETRTSEKIGTFIGIGFGVLITVIGFQNLRIGLRNRRTGAPQAPAATAAPWPQQGQAQQGQPQTTQQGWPHPEQPQQAQPQTTQQGWLPPQGPPSTRGGR